MDWDQDGKLDILSGSYLTPGVLAGHLQFLKGKQGIEFESATTVENEEGRPVLNLAVDDSGDMQLKLKNYCTHQHAIDYDNDGDLDLVVGSNMDQFYFHENVAESGKAPLLKATSVTLPVSLPLPMRHSAPHLADWDNDGDLDLISGSSAGGVFISENTGTRSEPVYQEFKILIPLTESESPVVDQRSDNIDFEIAGSTRVWATDFNSDGWLDLLIGDCSSVMELNEGVTEEEFDVAFEAASETSTVALDKCVTRKSTGFVWVYLRKPPAEL